MNNGEGQIGCRYALLTDRCVDERRLLGGGTLVVDDELMDGHDMVNVCRHQRRWGRPGKAEHHVRVVVKSWGTFDTSFRGQCVQK